MPQQFAAPQFVDDPALIDDLQFVISGQDAAQDSGYLVKSFIGLGDVEGAANFSIPVRILAGCAMRQSVPAGETPLKYVIVSVIVGETTSSVVRAYEDVQQGESDFLKIRSNLRSVVSILNDVFPRPVSNPDEAETEPVEDETEQVSDDLAIIGGPSDANPNPQV